MQLETKLRSKLVLVLFVYARDKRWLDTYGTSIGWFQLSDVRVKISFQAWLKHSTLNLNDEWQSDFHDR